MNTETHIKEKHTTTEYRVQKRTLCAFPTHFFSRKRWQMVVFCETITHKHEQEQTFTIGAVIWLDETGTTPPCTPHPLTQHAHTHAHTQDEPLPSSQPKQRGGRDKRCLFCTGLAENACTERSALSKSTANVFDTTKQVPNQKKTNQTAQKRNVRSHSIIGTASQHRDQDW